MRTLAIDIGTKRVGLALSDQGGQYATPLDVLIVSSPDQAIAQILPVIAKEGVEQILLGLPLNMDDSVGRAARSALAWGQSLAARSGKPVLYVDERLSSFAAEQTLADRRPLRAIAPTPRIVAAACGPDSGALGAASLAHDAAGLARDAAGLARDAAGLFHDAANERSHR